MPIDFTPGIDWKKEATTTLSFADSITRQVERETSQDISLVDNYSRAITLLREKSSVVSLVDNYARTVNAAKELSNALSLVSAFSRVATISKSYSEAVSIFDGTVYNAQVIFNTVLSFSESINKQVELQALTEVLSILDEVSSQVGSVLLVTRTVHLALTK